MSETVNKDFKVKHGLVVAEGGTFGAPVIVGNPTLLNHAATKAYVDAHSGGGSGGGSIVVSETAPEVPVEGSGWFNSVTGKLYIYFDSFWVELSYSEVGPQGSMGIQGIKGDKGDTGDPGPVNVLTIGTVDSGSNASATITGTSPNQILNLVLPQGIQGIQGLKGNTGDTGPKGDTGSVGPAGPAGPKGDTGLPGQNGTNGSSGVLSVTFPILNAGSNSAAQLSLDSSVTLNGATQTLTNKTLSSFNISGQVTEDVLLITDAFSGYTYNTKSGGIHYFINQATNGGVLNFRGDATTSLNSTLGVGKTITISLLITNGATPYGPSVIQVDGTNATVKWQGGITPAPNASSVDLYSFTIIKIANNSFTILGSQSKFA